MYIFLTSEFVYGSEVWFVAQLQRDTWDRVLLEALSAERVSAANLLNKSIEAAQTAQKYVSNVTPDRLVVRVTVE